MAEEQLINQIAIYKGRTCNHETTITMLDASLIFNSNPLLTL